MIQRIKKFWFLITTILVLIQTALAFFLLYKKSESENLKDIIIVLAGIYIFAFLVLALMSFSSKRYSHEAMSRFKRSKRLTIRLINLIMLAMNILLIINSDGGVAIAPIFMIFVNILLIYIDVKIAEFEDNRARKKKRKLREKREEERAKVLEENITAENKAETHHKKRRFFGDFSAKKK